MPNGSYKLVSAIVLYYSSTTVDSENFDGTDSPRAQTSSCVANSELL